ncbi:MAG: hypothetical protein KatS3mg060_0896 [Dehalococcoidia bacterium]|nr:MAG: hypothetical protein KatS3mg060_0896 [Dehalococcoidia bacterium]
MQTVRARWRALAVILLVCSAALAIVAPRSAAAETKPCTEQGFQEAATAPGGTFDFSCGVNTTITVNGGYSLNAVPIGGTLTIDGGNRLTVRPKNPNTTLFLITGIGNTNKTLVLRNMIVENWTQGTIHGSVISFAPTHTVIVENVTFRNNSATNGRAGGVIFAGGVLTVTASTFTNNLATGGIDAGGGAIVAEARARSLSITNSTFISNTGVVGGAISTTITTTISSSSFISNTATRTPGPGEDIESVGGAITLGEEFNFPFVVSNSYFRENRAVAHAVLNIPAGGSGRARGGAIYHGLSGSGGITVTSTSFISNTASAAGAFSASPGSGLAEGGAIANRSFASPMVISATTFVGNLAYAKGANQNPAGSGGAPGDAYGGAIFSYSSQTRVTNSTLALNQANGESEGAGNSPAANGSGRGGGISLGGAAGLVLSYTTIFSNSVSFNGTNGVGEGAGIFVDGAATAQVRGTIIAKNTLKTSPVQNCASGANVTSNGYNLSDVPGCNFIGTGDVQNAANPNLGAPANNGGPSIGSATNPGVLLTMLPGAGSPAIDTGGTSANGCPSVDERGASRPAGPQCDKGAVEVGGALPATPTPTPSVTPTSTAVPSPTATLAPGQQLRVRVPVTSLNRPADVTSLTGGW